MPIHNENEACTHTEFKMGGGTCHLTLDRESIQTFDLDCGLCPITQNFFFFFYRFCLKQLDMKTKMINQRAIFVNEVIVVTC